MTLDTLVHTDKQVNKRTAPNNAECESVCNVRKAGEPKSRYKANDVYNNVCKPMGIKTNSAR